MSETTPNAKGPAPVQCTPEATEPTLIPADQVNPEDIGALSLRSVDGVAHLVVSGGNYIPSELAIVTSDGAAQQVRYSAIKLSNVILVGGQTRMPRVQQSESRA